MPSKRQLSRDNESLKGQLKEMQEIAAFSIETSRLGVLALAEQLQPGPEDLERLAKEFPQWQVSCRTVTQGWDDEERKIVKEFRRDMSDLRPELFGDRETYLRFFDGEFFDDGLRNAMSIIPPISGSDWIGGSGDLVNRGPGSSITMTIEDEASLTKLDLMRVAAAERYLIDENLLSTQPIAA